MIRTLISAPAFLERSLRVSAIVAAVLLHAGSAPAQIKVDDTVLHTSPRNPSGITAERNRIINFIWGGAGFPSTKMPSMRQIVSSPIGHLTNVLYVEALRITMDRGEYTLAYHFVPASGRRNRLVIVHEGHACYLDDGPGSGHADGGIQRTVRALLANGYSVLAISMPKMSPPNQELHDPGNCGTGDHASMFNVPLSAGNALKFFPEPVIASINYLSSQYQDFNMVGLSGGGWTTTIASAVDTRIRLSFPVAGTLPLYLRYEPYSSHDLEQFVGAFYGAAMSGTAGIAGYLDLYLLASRGPGRHHIQILNRHDDCCFGEGEHNAAALGIAFEPALRIYETRLKTMATELGGSFRTYVDEVSPSHMISDNAINNVILPVLADARSAGTIATTIRSNWGDRFCIDVPNFGRPAQDHDYAQIFTCHGAANQEWTFQSDGTIRSQWGGLCLDVPHFGRPPRNGDQLQVIHCHGGINQQFDLLSDGSLRSRWNGLCVDVSDFGRGPRNGDKLQVFRCHGSPNQSFSANKLTTAISSAWSPGLCVDVPDFGRPPRPGDRMQVFQCHGTNNQRFSLGSDRTVRTEFGALCVTVPDLGRPPRNGDVLTVGVCDGSVNQQFQFELDGTIRSCAAGNLCIDIPDFGRAPQNHDALQLYDCHGSPNQKFIVRQ